MIMIRRCGEKGCEEKVLRVPEHITTPPGVQHSVIKKNRQLLIITTHNDDVIIMFVRRVGVSCELTSCVDTCARMILKGPI